MQKKKPSQRSFKKVMFFYCTVLALKKYDAVKNKDITKPQQEGFLSQVEKRRQIQIIFLYSSSDTVRFYPENYTTFTVEYLNKHHGGSSLIGTEQRNKDKGRQAFF